MISLKVGDFTKIGGVEKNELTRLLGARKEGVRKSVPSGANSTGIFEVERGWFFQRSGTITAGIEWHKIKLEK